MEETIVDIKPIIKSGKKPGGRPVSEGWSLYDFEKVDEGAKAGAKCGKCGNVLKNTSISRMANHRKRCGVKAERTVQKEFRSKAETDVEELQTEQNETILWTTDDVHDIDRFVDESREQQAVPLDKVNQTAMDIIQEDIRRHRKSSHPKSRSDSSSIDSALPSFLIGCNLSFDVVDSPHFKKFVRELNRDYQIPTSQQLKARVLSQLNQPSEKSKSKKRRYYESESSETD